MDNIFGGRGAWPNDRGHRMDCSSCAALHMVGPAAGAEGAADAANPMHVQCAKACGPPACSQGIGPFPPSPLAACPPPLPAHGVAHGDAADDRRLARDDVDALQQAAVAVGDVALEVVGLRRQGAAAGRK